MGGSVRGIRLTRHDAQVGEDFSIGHLAGCGKKEFRSLLPHSRLSQ
jgi:hypothetical protein